MIFLGFYSWFHGRLSTKKKIFYAQATFILGEICPLKKLEGYEVNEGRKKCYLCLSWNWNGAGKKQIDNGSIFFPNLRGRKIVTMHRQNGGKKNPRMKICWRILYSWEAEEAVAKNFVLTKNANGGTFSELETTGFFFLIFTSFLLFWKKFN